MRRLDRRRSAKSTTPWCACARCFSTTAPRSPAATPGWGFRCSTASPSCRAWPFYQTRRQPRRDCRAPVSNVWPRTATARPKLWCRRRSWASSGTARATHPGTAQTLAPARPLTTRTSWPESCTKLSCPACSCALASSSRERICARSRASPNWARTCGCSPTSATPSTSSSRWSTTAHSAS